MQGLRLGMHPLGKPCHCYQATTTLPLYRMLNLRQEYIKSAQTIQHLQKRVLTTKSVHDSEVACLITATKDCSETGNSPSEAGLSGRRPF